MESNVTQSLNIYQKLVKARSLMNSIVMTGVNRYSNYTYASSSDILTCVKKAMDEAGLLMLTRVLEYHEEIVSQNKDKPSLKISLKIEYRFINIDSPNEVEIFIWPANYIESTPSESIKGYAKALTYAQKYFLVQQFLLPRDEDDPDNQVDYPMSQESQKKQAVQQTLSNKITPTDGIERQIKKPSAPAPVEKDKPSAPAQTAPAPVEKPLTKMEVITRKEAYNLRVYIYNLAKDNNISVEQASKFGEDLGLTCSYQEMTLAQLERFSEYFATRILMQKNNLSMDDLNIAIKKVSEVTKLRDMVNWELRNVYKNLDAMIKERATNNKPAPEPSEDNQQEDELPDKITSENVESRLNAIAESAKATVAIDDGKKK